MADSPASVKMEREDKESAAIPEEKAGEPSAILPMTPESKQLAAVIATAVATAMAGKSASPDSSSSMVRYSAGVSLASRTRSIISIVRNLKLHLVTLPGANLASNELLLKLCKAYFALRQLTDQAGAFSTPMSVALRRRFPRRRPPCPCCKFTSSTAIPRNRPVRRGEIFASLYHQGPSAATWVLWAGLERLFSSTACPLVLGSPHITEFYMIFIIKLLHPAPLMNSPSSSTCSHLLLVTSSHLDFPGGVMNRLSSPVGVLAP